MYEPKTAQLFTEEDYINERGPLEEGEVAGKMDSRSNSYDTVPCPVVYLPHSCDEWVIGGRQQVEAMIKDLQELLGRMPA